MKRLAEWIAGLAGWRRALLAVLAGAFATLALPPIGLWPALFLSLPVLLLLLEGAGGLRRAFWAGFWWSYGYFVAGVYWIGIALLVDPERFAWLLPFASLGLPLVFALFPAAAGVLAVALGRRGPALLLALAGAWIIGEYARGHVLTGFPWNPLAVAWIDLPAAVQGAALVGAYGVGGLTVLLAGLPFLLLTAQPRGRLGLAALAFVLAGGFLAYGFAVVPSGPAARVEPAVRLRLVQGNIDQRMKHSDEARASHFNRHMELSTQPAADGRRPRIIVWPETALPYVLDAAPQLPRVVGSIVGDDGIALIGAVRIEDGPDLKAWNSLHALRRDGTLAGTYDKHHLVPFGEYLPLRGVLGLFGLDKLAVGAVDFTAGPGPVSLDLPGLPAVLPLICYEAIFPEAAHDPARRPAWLVNVTNDAWFGTSAGPPQHLAQARLRAIEQGLPLARAANTGISALVDPFGRVEQALPLGVAGVIDGDLPAARAETMFSRLGLLATGGFAGLLVLFGLFWRRIAS